jgi:NAD(P)-dependent dehydrogenase (short-subunit alcohol dehydrogenase family)
MHAMKTILVTGSSTGLGFAAAVALARAGHHVVATMRDPARAPELQAVASKGGLPITVLAMDVDDAASVKGAVDTATAARGRIDVLVNNAGIAMLGSVEETSLDAFRAIMETNYFGALRCIQAVLPAMRERRDGRIINVTSVAGRLAFPGQSAYAASKFALEAASEALAAEVRPFGIRVNILEPGVIETPIFGKGPDVSGQIYAGGRRMNAIFAAALENPVPASVIGDEIARIVADDSWTLRYPGGPAAAGLMGWRASMTDEQFVAMQALDASAWCVYIETILGLGVRKHLAPSGV